MFWMNKNVFYARSVTDYSGLVQVIHHFHNTYIISCTRKKIIENYTSQNKIDTDVSRIPDRVIVEFMQTNV